MEMGKGAETLGNSFVPVVRQNQGVGASGLAGHLTIPKIPKFNKID